MGIELLKIQVWETRLGVYLLKVVAEHFISITIKNKQTNLNQELCRCRHVNKD